MGRVVLFANMELVTWNRWSSSSSCELARFGRLTTARMAQQALANTDSVLLLLDFIVFSSNLALMQLPTAGALKQSGRPVPCLQDLPWVRTLAHRNGFGAPFKKTAKKYKGRQRFCS